jgi:hypothetical protein
MTSDKTLWLVKQVFTSFPQDVTGIKFFSMDRGCLYFLKVSRDGVMDYSHVGVYRDARQGPCEACMDLGQNWSERVVDETVVYNCMFQLESI